MRWQRVEPPLTMFMMGTSSPSLADDAEALARRRAALGLAALVGCDVRTAERAIVHGVDAIRPRRLREEIRAQLARIRPRVT